jgi:cell division septum initiation protein DivIVA
MDWRRVQALQQENLDLRHRAEEREEELAAAREANRRLMTEVNKTRS